MFRHILVPTDLTERSAGAIQLAMDMHTNCFSGEEQEGKISLLHVIQKVVEDEEEDFSDFYEDLKARARDRFEDIARDTRLPVEKHILVGSRVEEIVRFARENQVDLAVLSSHRIDPDNPAEGWGTISHKVGILAPCPVMLVK
ncbi:MAG: universal stress protein [Desulfohalobiaceae bacterium]|nr:universal stress protein [Desulfohalobiaceae bacterium]